MRWHVAWADDSWTVTWSRSHARSGGSALVALAIPKLIVWRTPGYVLWGARGNDVLIGSGVDRARQVVLNRRARQQRAMVQFTLVVRDQVTPAFERLVTQLAALGRPLDQFATTYRRSLLESARRTPR